MRAPFHPFRNRATAGSGAALVIVLSFLVLLSAVVLAYFGQAMIRRQISFSSAGQARADQVAFSALDLIKGDLVAEMHSGSTTETVAAYPLMIPSDNKTMLPYRSGAFASHPSLVKWSNGEPLWAQGGGYSDQGPVRADGDDVTSRPSANGRYIDAQRWEKPALGKPDPATPLPEPAWILLTRRGLLPDGGNAVVADLAKPAPSNADYVIGRFAYRIYDVGGLVDITAAGYPSSLSSSEIGRKGSPGTMDLTQLGLTGEEIDAILAWRNTASAASGTAYRDYIREFAPRHGFLKAAPGDQAFVGRQDFLDFWRDELTGKLDTSGDLVAQFTTFSREQNAPSWGPTVNAADQNGSNNGLDGNNGGAPLNGVYAYADAAKQNADVQNPLFPKVRVKSAFQRRDGRPAIVGEPLVENRFDLGKLSWLRHDGTMPAGVSSDDIKACFGLTRAADGSWTYDHGKAEGIMTLEEVASEGREPDFFELLQAGLLQGSLGLVTGDPTQPGSSAGGEYYRRTVASWTPSLVRTDNAGLVHAQPKYQVIQIGANIIDQNDEDGLPTEIILNGQRFFGVENLPYLNAVGYSVLRPREGVGIEPNTYQAYVHQWMTFSLWNPHRNAANPPAGSPQRFRILATSGEAFPSLHDLGVAGYPPVGRRFQSAVADTGYGPRTAGPAWIGWDMSAAYDHFARPRALTYDESFTSEAIGGPNINDPAGRIRTNPANLASSWDRAGIYLGYSFSPDHEEKVSANAPLRAAGFLPELVIYHAAKLNWGTPYTLELQYEDPAAAGVWHTYQLLTGLVPSRDGSGDPYMEPSDPEWARLIAEGVTAKYRNPGPLARDQDVYVIAGLDPRSTRLNIYPRRGQKVAETFLENTILTGPPVGPYFPKDPGSWHLWVNNNSTATGSYYLDPDRVLRPGDAAGWAGADPMTATATIQRPIRLDRPFRSVAELGYVFRDEPWKTLNFFSERSADLALLDIFCVGPESATGNQPAPAVVAGKLNINSASEAALRALISGVIRDYSVSDPHQAASSITGENDIQGLAEAIVARIQAAGPLINRGQLPLVYPQDTTTNTLYPGIKVQREALVRGVIDGTGTRTWNLMIDLIAQSGRFRISATKLDDFVVEGEKRYWLHVAIDRFSGKVVDSQLEPVIEW